MHARWLLQGARLGVQTSAPDYVSSALPPRSTGSRSASSSMPSVRVHYARCVSLHRSSQFADRLLQRGRLGVWVEDSGGGGGGGGGTRAASEGGCIDAML